MSSREEIYNGIDAAGSSRRSKRWRRKRELGVTSRAELKNNQPQPT